MPPAWLSRNALKTYLDSLAVRGLQALAKLQRYLRSPDAKRNARQRYRTRSNGPNDPNE
jgi:hypothetical protein